jgi:hypothetical protein
VKVVTKFPEPLRIQPRFAEGYKDKVVALSKNGDISSAIEQVKRVLSSTYLSQALMLTWKD